MAQSDRNLLTVGVLIVTVVVGILLWVAQLIDWTLIVPVVLVLFGLWMLVLGAIRSSQPAKYERSSFSTMALGLGAIAVGGAWFLFSINWVYSLVVILLVVAALIITVALKRK
jgi:hypothetical protein